MSLQRMNLESKTIRLRLVEETDASFILSLRLDDRYNQFLSKVSSDIESQKSWIRNYKIDEEEGNQFYFIIERLDGTPCGTVRVYDLKSDSFCWGSWILNEEKTKYAAIESALLVYEFGFRNLGFSKCHFDVMKENTKVISFHLKMGAEKNGEDDKNFYFCVDKLAIEKIKNRLKIN
ncbi:MAG: GNAT family N-acetyltransferase [Pseudomonadota bacterium]